MEERDLKKLDVIYEETKEFGRTQFVNEIYDLRRKIEIKDEWCKLIHAIGYDYDGYGNNLEQLKGMCDELVKYACSALECDDKTVIYTSILGGDTNILGENLKED